MLASLTLLRHASTMAVRAIAVACLVACGGRQQAPLAPAGDDRDEGGGLLARASMGLLTPDDREPRSFIDDPAARPRYDGAYGGDPYGGAAYGGATYAGWQVPQWSYTPHNRTPRYSVVNGSRGAIEGTVTWRGQPPVKVTSTCGPIDNPTLRVGTDRMARGVIVLIEKVAAGRATPLYTRPVSVGGIVAKRGCALVPAAQIVAPLPGSIAIHGDDQRTKVRVIPAQGKPTVHDLQEAGLVQLAVKPGVTRVEGTDGKLAAAWVLGLDTPYYAITDDQGRYRIDELPAGTYEVTFWQAPIATASPDGTWSYGRPIVMKRSVKVGTNTTQLSVTLAN